MTRGAGHCPDLMGQAFLDFFLVVVGPLRNALLVAKSYPDVFRGYLEAFRGYLEAFRSYLEVVRSYPEVFRGYLEVHRRRPGAINRAPDWFHPSGMPMFLSYR